MSVFGFHHRKEGFDGNEADSWVVEALDMPKESAHKVFVEMHKREQELKQLIYSNDIPVITDNPSILRERPQFHLLYEELDSMIQTIFNHEDQDLHNFEEVSKLKKRFKAAAEEAEDTVDVFLSTVHCRNNGYFPRSDVFQPSLHLEVAIRSIESIKIEFMTINIDNMKMDSSLRTDRLQTQSAGTSHTRNSRGSKKLLENVVVGFDRKTTLANKVFTDPYVAYHFHVRGWVTVSQTYDKRDLLIQVLSSIDDQLELEKATDCQLRAMLHKRLMGKRYLIVIDDIWSIEAWDKSQLFFPDDNTGSRILLTSRLTEVASHAKSHGLIHQLQHLTEEESWKLLCEKVFQGDECPQWLIEPGKQIAKNCHGLPLSVVVMAGVLAKETRTKDLWLKISCSFHSYIASDEKGCLETIALSYHHLPPHLRDCFLYLGGFPEDYPISSPRLLWLWMAEGFIQEDGSQSLKEIANGYLMDLVDRNLLIIDKWYAWGDVRRCKVHDLVRQVCVEKGKEENFFLKIDSPPSNNVCEVITTYKKRRVVTNQEMHIMSSSLPTTPSVRSLLCFTRKTTITDIISKFFPSFSLLRVLSLEKCRLLYFPPGLALLVHLRYLYIWLSSFQPSICILWNIQTLIVKTSSSPMVLPSNISNLVNLRHLRSNADLYLPSVGKPLNLEFITKVELGDGVDNFKKCFPRIKELTSTLYSDKENDFKVLHYLQILTLFGSVQREFRRSAPNLGKNHIIRFPETLKVLTLVRCGLPWSNMSIIQSLPNLEALILEDNGFEGTL
ncbi:unnamed protein product [Lactuca virosa]|uniref:NB-ARC domain-containing protein n=1 Tax=Lactuca virosa TaxID=75947 RepID=A0AAU9LYJ4_9ASTR|nr:unnamed protein product [Lactuca virosa]